MTPFSFLQQLKNNGVDLWIEGEKLLYQGPSTAFTPDIINTLKEMKPTLMEILQQKYICTNCQQHEEIPLHGSGCVHKTNGAYSQQWSLLSTLKYCPQGYWN